MVLVWSSLLRIRHQAKADVRHRCRQRQAVTRRAAEIKGISGVITPTAKGRVQTVIRLWPSGCMLMDRAGEVTYRESTFIQRISAPRECLGRCASPVCAQAEVPNQGVAPDVDAAIDPARGLLPLGVRGEAVRPAWVFLCTPVGILHGGNIGDSPNGPVRRPLGG